MSHVGSTYYRTYLIRGIHRCVYISLGRGGKLTRADSHCSVQLKLLAGALIARAAWRVRPLDGLPVESEQRGRGARRRPQRAHQREVARGRVQERGRPQVVHRRLVRHAHPRESLQPLRRPVVGLSREHCAAPTQPGMPQAARDCGAFAQVVVAGVYAGTEEHNRREGGAVRCLRHLGAEAEHLDDEGVARRCAARLDDCKLLVALPRLGATNREVVPLRRMTRGQRRVLRRLILCVVAHGKCRQDCREKVLSFLAAEGLAKGQWQGGVAHAVPKFFVSVRL
mmetsp:Transcript_15409/g.38205  ORF Transcript_15409/g.38205 Transcript_15409/m.38205 type:complete len:282 (+) Transcript_15409:28-873(+)